MTGASPTEIQWYLARDGQQHGPLNDIEMRKLVELGYLRETDLIWRQGFPDWRPAPSVFPPPGPAKLPAPAAPPPPVAAAPQPPATAPAPQPSRTAPPTAQPAPVAQQLRPAAQPQPQPQVQQPQAQAPAPQQQQPAERRQPQFIPQTQPIAAQPAPVRAPAPMAPAASAPAPPAQGAAPAPAAPKPSPIGRAMVPVPAEPADDEIDEVEDAPRGRGRKIAVAATILLLLGGGGFAAYKYRDKLAKVVSSMPRPAAEATDKAPAAAGKPATALPKATIAYPKIAMLGALSGDTAAIDAHFQKQPVWAVVKKEFPEWYGERLAEVAKLNAEKQPEPAVAKHIVQQLVALRRQHAEQALSASTPRLKTIASAFLDNLQRLRAYHTNACYSFISQGETSPVVVEMLQNQDHSGPIAAQVKAIFEAVGEGRAKPVKHGAPSKDDYTVLADQLTKLGWSQTDLQLFADPRALARTSPERVCKMVLDWFQAHIDIPDAAAQERLLVETLRPVVSG